MLETKIYIVDSQSFQKAVCAVKLIELVVVPKSNVVYTTQWIKSNLEEYK